MNELKSLTWKYFKEQKKEEIFEAIKTIFIAYLVLGWLFGILFFTYFGLTLQDYEGYDYNGKWWSFIPLALWSVFIIFILIIHFLSWLNDNWEWAERRAKQELKSKGKKK